MHIVNPGAKDDKSVVRILKDRATKVIDERVWKKPVSGREEDKLLKDVRNSVEEKGG